MENIYNSLLEKSNNQVESSSQTFTSGKKRYTIKTENNGDTTYASETSIAKLDGELLDYDPITYDSIDDLLDEEASLDGLFCDFEKCVSFTEDGKVKLDYLTEEFQTDKIITAKKDKNQSLTGLIIDFKRDEEFTDLYNNGVDCSMPSCKEYIDAVANGEDPDDDEIRDLLDEEEMRELIRGFNSKVQSCAELIPQGLYVIAGSKIYYLTADEYCNIYYHSNDSRMYKMIDEEGLRQLDAKLLQDKKQVLCTVSTIIKSKCLENRKYLDLNDVASIGTTKEAFLTNLLSNNKETYEFLASELKPKQDVK